MQQPFKMDMRKSVTGLHIALSGNFTKHDIANFTSHVNESLTDNCRIFLDVRKLLPMTPENCAIFKQCFAHIVPKNVIFKGEQGVKLGHQGNRILFMKDHDCKCAGACKSCACQSRAQNRNERFDFFKKKLAAG